MKSGDILAIKKRLLWLVFLTTNLVVDDDYAGREWIRSWLVCTMPLFPMWEVTSHRDDNFCHFLMDTLYILITRKDTGFLCFIYLCNQTQHQTFLSNMADNLRRAMQEIDLGSSDAPFVLPQEVVRQAAEENRFILIGRPVMPRRRNLRAIVATMPRIWGLEGLVRGRVIEGRRFQFIFPSEEAMETVIRRGPWAYAERMLTLQKWSPLMDLNLLNFIPLWLQIRGIPLQYMNREVIVHIARAMGQYIQMDYNEEVGGRMEFVRVRLNWNINSPLKFQRNFQFTPESILYSGSSTRGSGVSVRPAG